MISFYYPERLWATFLALIPIIIHLINFYKHKKVFFSDITLLKKIEKNTRKVRKIKDILLMIVRSLSILSLAIAFAGPYKTKTNKYSNIHNGKIGFFIDNSFSMQLRDENGILLDYAKTLAKKIIAKSTSINSFYLSTCDNYFTDLTKEEVLKEIDNIHLTSSTIDLGTLQIFFEKNEVWQIYLLTDLQKNIVKNYKQDSLINYFVIPLRASLTNNVSLDTCFITEQANSDYNALVFRVSNNSRKSITELPVKLYLNGQLKNVKTITMEEGESIVDTIKYNYSGEDNFLVGKLTLDDYPVTFDNTLFFSYKNKNKYNILVITDLKDNGIVKYIKAAFSDNEKNKEKKFNIDIVSSSDILQKNNIHYDAIFIGNLNFLPPNFSDRIIEWLQNNITVIYFANSFKERNNFNNKITEQVAGILLDGIDTSYQEIEYVLFETPFFKNSLKKPKEKIKYPRVSNILVVKYNSSKITTLIKTEKDLPVVLYYEAYPANFFVVTTDIFANKEFLYSPLFFVTLYNSVIKSEKIGQIYRYCSNSYIVELPYILPADLTVAVKHLDGKKEFIPYQQNAGNHIKVFLSASDIKQDGFYDFYSDTLHSILSFSYNREESNFSFIEPKKLRELLGNHSNVNVLEFKENILYSLDNINVKELWKWFVLIAFLMLLIELVLLKMYKK